MNQFNVPFSLYKQRLDGNVRIMIFKKRMKERNKKEKDNIGKRKQNTAYKEAIFTGNYETQLLKCFGENVACGMSSKTFNRSLNSSRISDIHF